MKTQFSQITLNENFRLVILITKLGRETPSNYLTHNQSPTTSRLWVADPC